MPAVARHLIDGGGAPTVELYQVGSHGEARRGAILFVHGNQGGRRIGARETVEYGLLPRLATSLNVTAAAVSQPGFGGSEGPADFCGPKTQDAIMSALAFLRDQPLIDPDRIVLYGHSRGAIASAMVAIRDVGLRGLILSSGVYDLEQVYNRSSPANQQAIAKEAGLTAESFLERSALRHVLELKAETLILHGREDDRAPVDQAEQLSEALDDAGVSVSLKIFDCGHRLPWQHVKAALRPFLLKMFEGETERAYEGLFKVPWTYH
jgi:dipeptidyl aminopeptidase/acylaminoacyl peptidase